MRLPRIITHNLGWKLLSVALATLLWMSLRSGVPGRLKQGGTLSFPRREVALLKSAADDRGWRLEPATVGLTVGGSPDVLERLRPEDLQVFIHPGVALSAAPALRPVQVHAPAGITVLSIDPPAVTVLPAPRKASSKP